MVVPAIDAASGIAGANVRVVSTVDYMKQALRFIDRGFAEADKDLSDEQLHFVPEGQTHSIAWCMWHAARIEDFFFQRVYGGGQEEWRTGGWAERCGLPDRGFGTGQSTEEAQSVRIGDRDAFHAYQAEVHRRAMAYFDTLTEADLDRETKLGDAVEPLGHSINLHLTVHLNGHRGEVNMLRGMLGFPPVLVNQGG
jgi:uncharacterized damage-inducible protein DinB